MNTKIMLIIVIALCVGCASGWQAIETLKYPALDLELYERVLDSELCQQQITYIRNSSLLSLRFIDNGLRLPRGILEGNMFDLGNYYGCLGINENVGTSQTQGKYCSISVPLEQDLQLPSIPTDWPGIDWPDINWPDWPEILPNTDLVNDLKKYNEYTLSVQRTTGAGSMGSTLSQLTLNMALCVPEACTAKEGLEGLQLNLTQLGFKYEENYCRLPRDKTWTPADYVATILFSIIGLLTLMSTAYDVCSTVILKKDSKHVNRLYQSFSVYTNCKRMTNFPSNPSNIECLDGIRVVSITWIIVGHTYSTHLGLPMYNSLHILDWFNSLPSIWITAAPISVDTFFLISGLLLVYNLAGKFNKMKLLKNLNLFYFNRLVRMFPILAAWILIVVSFLHRTADGPRWTPVVDNVETCRVYWWTTLLYIQNFYNPDALCLGQTWYLAVDMQLFVLSPLVLFWVLHGKKSAWISLSFVLIGLLVSNTIYNALNGFRSAIVNAGQIGSGFDYHMYYYFNTFTRSSPFVVGMMFGYLLHSTRNTKVQLSKGIATLCWILSISLISVIIYLHYPNQKSDWDSPIMDIVINSYTRPAWGCAIGWVIFACHTGYGGALNWFLSLKTWKLPSRISYAMYIVHFQLIMLVNGTAVSPVYFSDSYFVFRFFGDLMLTLIVSYLMCVLIDAPFSTLFKLLLGGGRGPRQRKPEEITKPIEIYVNDEMKTKL